MLRIITGVPGSGKTYFAVYEIVNRFYRWDKNLFLFLQKDTKKPVTIFTNIDGLKLDHINLDHYLNQHNLEVKQFFNVSYQEKLLKTYPKIVYLIDEAQRFFDKKLYDKDVFFLFQYHRHLGLDFYLITQSLKTLPLPIVELIEYEIIAVRRTNRLKNVFVYKFVSNGETFGKKYLKADQRIFNIYKSFQLEETIKQDVQPVKKYSLLALLLIVVVVFSFTFFLKSFFNPPIKSTKLSDLSSTVNATMKSTLKNNDVKNNDVNKDVKKLSKSDSNVFSKSLASKSAIIEDQRINSSLINDPSSLAIDTFWIPLGVVRGTGTVYANDKILYYYIFDKFFRPDEMPYPVFRKDNLYFVLVPSSIIPKRVFTEEAFLFRSDSSFNPSNALSDSSDNQSHNFEDFPLKKRFIEQSIKSNPLPSLY